MKSDDIASVEQCIAVQQEKIAQADEFVMQILIPATDLEGLKRRGLRGGTGTASRPQRIQTF